MTLKFRKLRLRNWKNFAQVDMDIQDRVSLVGPNALGKSGAFKKMR